MVPAVDVGVVGEHGDGRRGGVLEHGRGVVDGHRWVVDGGDGDLDRVRGCDAGGDREGDGAGRRRRVLAGVDVGHRGEGGGVLRRGAAAGEDDGLGGADALGDAVSHVVVDPVEDVLPALEAGRDADRAVGDGEAVGVRDRDAGVDGGGGIVLGVGERPGRVHQRRRIRDARDRDRDRGDGAAVEGVGERVRGGTGRVVAVVGVGLVGEPGVGAGTATGEHHGAVGRVAGRGDRHRAAVDVGVVGQAPRSQSPRRPRSRWRRRPPRPARRRRR